MEEKKKQTNPGGAKLSYEELSKAASELHVQYQKLMSEYKKVVEALNNRDMEYSTMFIQMMFKVLEHPDYYAPDFPKWCAEKIEDAIKTFDLAMSEAAKEASKESNSEA